MSEINSKVIYNFECPEFQSFYKFMFTFNEKKKKLSLDVVKLYFESLFYKKYPICKEFVEFLEVKNVILT